MGQLSYVSFPSPITYIKEQLMRKLTSSFLCIDVIYSVCSCICRRE